MVCADTKHIMLGIDKKCAVLEATTTPKSVAEISMECKIPIWTTYRIVHELCGRNLLKTSCSIKDGRKYFLYKTKMNMRIFDMFE